MRPENLRIKPKNKNNTRYSKLNPKSKKSIVFSEPCVSDLAPTDRHPHVLDKFRTFRIQNWVFDEISKWFCMVLRGEAKKYSFETKKLEHRPNIERNTPKILRFLVEKIYLRSFSKQNHAESSRNFVKNSVLDPKCAKFDQKSWFGHVRTCPGGQVLTANQRKYFYFFRFYTFLFL